MPIDLATLKSAVVIEDLDQAFAMLSKAQAQHDEALPGRKGTTSIARAKNGAICIHKASDRTVIEKLLGTDGAPTPPSPEELQQLAAKRGFPWDKQYPDRMKTWWASDERVDAHGDIVKQNWNFDEFSKNSPMPFNHQWYGLTVGKHLDWKVAERRSADYSGPALWLCGVFATAETDPDADRVFRHVDAGLLPAGSVGFYSNKVVDVKDEEERKKLGLGRYGYILDDNHLLEFSPTMIGANPGALTTFQNAKARGLLKPEDMQHLRELQRRAIIRGAGDVQAWTETDRQFRSLSKLLFPQLAIEPHVELDTPITEDQTAARKAKAYTPPAVKAAAMTMDEKLDALAQKVDELTTAYNEGMLSIMQALGDIQEAVEEGQEPEEPGETEPSAPGGAATNPGALARTPGAGKGNSPEEEDEQPQKKDRSVAQLVLSRLANRKA